MRPVTTITASMNGHPGAKPDAPVRVEDLLARCNTLLSELEEFKNFVAEAKEGSTHALPSIGVVEQAVDLRQFHAPIVAELKSLQKVSLDNSILFVNSSQKLHNVPILLLYPDFFISSVILPCPCLRLLEIPSFYLEALYESYMTRY